MTDPLAQRFARLPAASPADGLRLTLGSLRDYAALAQHHYRGGRPATATRVLVLRHDRPTPAQRFARHAGLATGDTRGDADADDDAGPASPRRTTRRHRPPPDRDAAADGIAAVLVESLPSLSCRLRDYALRDRFGSWLGGRERAAMLGEELRCISRVIVDPRWRGLGLAVRLVRHALATAQTPFTEALAAMGQVHPFFEKAGMTAHRRPRHAFDQRLVAAMAVVGVSPTDLSMLRRVERRIAALDPLARVWLLSELSRWRRHAFGRGGGPASDDPRAVLIAARRRLLLPPVYYLHDNR